MFSPYVLILVWIGFVALVTSRVQFQRLETVCGTKEPRYPWLFAFLVFLPIIWMAGNRTYVGDTYAYRTTFLKMPSSFAEIPAYMQGITKDKGFLSKEYMQVAKNPPNTLTLKSVDIKSFSM